ncbi:hypothetical protein [Pygmaiobacter massiliensis]|uniref:hypothetical protein n=1 Tax=Pygmaiobacter massiliensis TaxID=1917873 RepID=UPI002A80B971|nr:hypothetical protein [Pygmaiobacter massiliensis]MDY4784901.1 hypothetical protein [Pygmaiobacter massiliensis]
MPQGIAFAYVKGCGNLAGFAAGKETKRSPLRLVLISAKAVSRRFRYIFVSVAPFFHPACGIDYKRKNSAAQEKGFSAALTFATPAKLMPKNKKEIIGPVPNNLFLLYLSYHKSSKNSRLVIVYIRGILVSQRW